MTDNTSIGRRAFLLSLGVGIVGACAAKGNAVELRAESQLSALEADLGGRVGVFALNTADGRRIAYRGDERFAMCSTFKWLLAATVLAKVDGGELSLDRRVSFSSADLLAYAPVTTARVSEGSLSVEELSAAAVTVSDNTAANLLLGLIGGPLELTDQLRRWGDGVTRLDRTEPSLNTNTPGDERDTTTPHAMVTSMRSVLLGKKLTSASTAKLIGWLQDSRTGLSRIRAGIPAEWKAGDKTGSGSNGAINDVAILWPTERAPILLAVYMSGSRAAPDALNAAHARIGNLVAREFS